MNEQMKCRKAKKKKILFRLNTLDERANINGEFIYHF